MAKQYTNEMNEAFNTCLQDPQALLSKALEQRNMKDFKIALDMEGDPTRSDPITNVSLFEKALQTSGCSEFVEECIRRGCKCDYINRRSNKAPINYAADSKDPKIMANILKLKNIPVDTKYANLTPLNSLSKNLTNDNYIDVKECIKQLLDYGANPNIPDQTERTPILHIINNKKLDDDKKKEIMKLLLETSKIDLDTFRDGEARARLASRFPDLQLPSEVTNILNYESLCVLLQNGNEEKFIKSFQEYQTNLSADHADNQQNIEQEHNTDLLIEAIKRGFNDVVDYILSLGNINVNSNQIEVACAWGNFKALQKLLDDDELKIRKNDNLLINVIKSLDEPNYNSNFSNYYKCFYTLLDSDKIDINETDQSGSSALHYAVKYKNDKAIMELLKRGAYIGEKSIFNDLPITDINPEILEEYLDSCITTNGLKVGDPSFEIIMNYSNLIPRQKASKTVSSSSSKIENEMTPIEHISQSKELRHLLKHPLITSFLFLKWHRLSIFFYLNFIFYSIFCVSLVAFIILKFHNTANDAVINLFFILSILGLCYLIIREVIQFMLSLNGYFRTYVNYLEIVLIILTIITLTEPNYEQEGQRVLAVVTILLASIELCWLVGSLPVLSISTHMLMLRAVSSSFMKSFTLYSIFIITFSLCFYILFGKPGSLIVHVAEDVLKEKVSETVASATKDEKVSEDGEFNKFVNPFTAIIKTIVMLTGEFDAGDIDFNSFYSYIIFLLFVCFMSIVLFNLLNGLAVSDTQVIKSQAELNGSICRTEILSSYEKSLTGRNGKTGFIINRQPFQSICKRFINLFPDYIDGSYISILPNDRNQVLIPISTSTELGPITSKFNGTSTLLTRKTSTIYDLDREKKVIDAPVKLLPCFCSCLSGKCSQMDKRTIKTALAIIDKNQQNSKIKKKGQESEDRLQKIEDKIETILELLREMRP